MKKINYLAFSLIALAAISSCSKVPNEATFLFNSQIDTEIHTELQNGLINSVEPDNYIAQHDLELTTFSNSGPQAIKFSFTVNTDNNATASSYDLYLSEKEDDFTDAYKITSSNTDIDIYNLKLDTTYYYKVTANYKGDSFTSDVFSFKVEDSIIRNIYVDGVENVRDLGGYLTEDGQKIKQGLIYRTAQFNYDTSDNNAIKSAPTEKGLDTLLNVLKIKTDVDVREKENRQGKDETIGISASPLGNSVNYQYLPLRFGGSNIFSLEQNKDNIKKFFELCADESNYPIAFHCVRGTDRTGALAWALESLCGVNETDLYKDYLFSNFANIGGSVIRKKNIDGTSFYPYGISIANGDSISEKTMNYLINNIGVSRSTLEAIKDILIEK